MEPEVRVLADVAAEKDAIEAKAEAVAGVSSVDNKLEVKSGSSAAPKTP